MPSIGERPGVYATYEVTGISYSGMATGTVGVAAASVSGTDGEIYNITSYASAVSAFGSAANITELVRILIKNGVETIKAIPLIPGVGETVPSDEAYEAAFESLVAEEDVKIIICDSADADVHDALREAIVSADERYQHKIGIVEGCGTVEDDVSAAEDINSERIVMVSPPAINKDGTAAVTGSLSAAVAGVVIGEQDPAIPLNGAELFGLGGVSAAFSDGDITSLVRGGVTPVECIGGAISVVRGITTKTKTGGFADASFRELTTVLIIDDVIPTVRNALRAGFTRTKNNARTRGAIRTRVIVELEKKITAEIIDSYDNVTVTQNANDPTICDVSFEFTVTHGLNQIRLTAYITV